MIEPQQILKKTQDTPWNVIDNEVVVLNLDSGHYYILNETGCRIWEMLDGNKTVADIAGGLCQEYDVTQKVAIRDTGKILDDLLKEKLVEIIA